MSRCVNLSVTNSRLGFAEKVVEALMGFEIPFRWRDVREVTLEWGKENPEQLSLL